jgi:predicted dehydrogenase
MNILAGKKWRGGYLDYYREPDEFRIEVSVWQDLEKLEDLYFIRRKSLRLVWNYFREIGLRAVIRKIFSRLQESGRNEKYTACGAGKVIEAPGDADIKKGDMVAFIVPAGQCAERIVLPKGLLVKTGFVDPGAEIFYFAASGDKERFWEAFAGWNKYSGMPLPQSAASLDKVAELTLKLDRNKSRKLRKSGDRIAEHYERKIRYANKTAVLFGYGNYAKVNILPHVESCLSLAAVHEIDPAQIPNPIKGLASWDTSPYFREAEFYDAAFIAGYHHAHAKLAAVAMERGMYAVTEKPLVTTRGDLDLLLHSLSSPSRFFACFHKRYLALNRFVHPDLDIKKGDPFSYHAIVYEVALPKQHWYRWPSSHLRVLVDGCHWIDHFLYLNNFSPVKKHAAFEGPDGSANVSLTLENGSFFTMALTTAGSPRVGVTEHIELRRDNVTVTMTNDSYYLAEGPEKAIRRASVPKMACYEAMYREISAKIAAGKTGDPADWVRVSAEAALLLEEDILNLRKKDETSNPKL